jgi:tetratricopeptide (TPR) repeat protein
VAGSNFVLEMDQAARRARRTLGVLSPRALEASYVRQEWAQRLAGDPTGEQRSLVLVRVEPCEPEGLLGPVVYIDLVDLDEAAARTRLREELTAVVRGERRLPTEPAFPGTGPAAVVPGVQRSRFPTALPPVWNVPYRRNPDFTGREQALAGLAEQLGRGAAAVTQALQGGGGVGKTALAIEYAYRHRSEFDVVWWVRAETPATLAGDYTDLAVALGLDRVDQADQQLMAAVVRRWLEDHDRWLLVLDNAEAPDTPTGLRPPLAVLVDLLPRVVQGQVLVTSRDASWEQHASLAELEVFTAGEAVEFLLARSGGRDEQAAVDVAELLGLLPLALEQAGAYVRETRIALAAYVQRLREFPALTLTKGRPQHRDAADTVATTWQVSVERVRPVPGAMVLLEICAFLAPEEIPRSLFTQQLEPASDELALLGDNPFVLDEAIAGLRRYGLVKAGEQTVTVHRLLQQVVRDRLDAATTASRVGLAVRLLAAAFPFEGFRRPGVWPVCAQLLSHALAVAGYGEAKVIEGAATGELLDRAAGYLLGRARYIEAQTLRERALAVAEATFGPLHPMVGTRLTYLGHLLMRAGEPAAALPLQERALAVFEAVLPEDDPWVAVTLTNLGDTLHVLGDLPNARRHLERALAIREVCYGPDHPDYPDIATTLSKLGSVLHDQGDLERARSLHEQALTIRQAHLDPDHPYIGATLGKLGSVLRDQGDLNGARTLLGRALGVYEAGLGPDHPETIRSREALAAAAAEK